MQISDSYNYRKQPEVVLTGKRQKFLAGRIKAAQNNYSKQHLNTQKGKIFSLRI